MAPKPVMDVNPQAAPVEAPKEIAPETGLEQGNRDAAAGIEGGVIELAARGAWYGDGSDCFQGHDDLTNRE